MNAHNDANDDDSTDPLDRLPENWNAYGGNRSRSYYTTRLETERADDGYYAEVYWDAGEPHSVVFYETHGRNEDGDTDIDEYPCYSEQFGTAEAAERAAVQKARELEGLEVNDE